MRAGTPNRHQGTGAIIVIARGVALSLKVGFGFEGVKRIPCNSNLQITD